MNILSVFFSSKCSLFHNSNVFGSCINVLFTFYIQAVLKFKKNHSGAKRLMPATVDTVLCAPDDG